MKLPTIEFKTESLPEPLTPIIQKMAPRFKDRCRSNDFGFYSWAGLDHKPLIAEIRKIAEPLEKADCTLGIGIGGSFQGALAIQRAICSDTPNFRWLSNIDPGEIEATREYLNGKNASCIVISKSGETTETLAALFHFARQFAPGKVVAITDPESGTLRKIAHSQGWRTLPVPSNIGGRFSVLTPVGLLPCEVLGISSNDLLQGAREMHGALENVRPEENPAFQLAAFLFLQDTKSKRPIQYLIPYWSKLRSIADWYVQLFAESLGKDRKGPTPVAALGTTDQHSILQLLKDGPSDKVVGFLEVQTVGKTSIGTPPFPVDAKWSYLTKATFEEVTLKASLATQRSLENSNQPCYRIQLPALDAKNLGALLFLLETSAAFAGELYKVNAFDQPGVEESKRLLRESLS